MTFNKDGKASLAGQTKVDCNKSGGGGGGGSAQPKECPPGEAGKEDKKPTQDPGRVVLLPVRYAVGNKGPGEGTYRYKSASLKTNFPPLEKAQYALRILRDGYVYVYFEEKLDCFRVGEEGNLHREWTNERDPGRKVKTEQDALTVPVDAKCGDFAGVMLAFSDHLWHPNQRWKIIDNINKCRDHQMQSFALSSPERDFLPLTALGKEVEEYAGLAGKYHWWSEHPPKIKEYKPADRISDLQALAPKDYVVALHDPVGITHELANLVERDLEFIRKYTTAPTKDEIPHISATECKQRADRFRRKVIADYIERVYLGRYLQNSRSEGETVEDTVGAIVKARQEAFRADPANKYKTASSVEALKADIVARSNTSWEARRMRKHVKEEERIEFLEKYLRELAPLQESYLTRKKDRHQWFSTLKKKDSPDTLGAAWDTYELMLKGEAADKDREHHTISIGRAIVALTSGAIPNMLDEPEFKFLAQYIESDPDSHIYRALIAGDLQGLMDTLEGNIDRSADLIGGTADLIEEIHKKYPLKGPLEVYLTEIIDHVTTYVLHKVDATKVWGKKQMEALVNEANVARLLRIITARAGLLIQVKEVPLKTLIQQIGEAAKVPGGLNPSQLVTNEGSLNKAIAVFEVTEASSKKVVPNFFRGYGAAGVGGVVGLFNLLNAKSALVQIRGEFKLENWTNMGSAVTGAVAAILELKIAAGEAIRIRQGGKLTTEARLARMKTRIGARIFGNAAAILTAVTDGIKGHKQIEKGQWLSGLLYTASGLTAGGSVFAAAAIGGLLGVLVGIILMGISVIMVMAAENAIARPMEVWLDSCIFGKHDLTPVKKYMTLEEEQDALAEAMYMPVVLEKNFDIYPNYPYNDPRVTPEASVSEFKLLLPGFQGGVSELVIEHNAPRKTDPKTKKVLVSDPTDWGSRDGSQYLAGGALIHYRHFISDWIVEEGEGWPDGRWKVKYRVFYKPTKEFKKWLFVPFEVEGGLLG